MDDINIPDLSAEFAKDVLGTPEIGGDGENRDPGVSPEVPPSPGPSPAPAPIDPVAELLKEYPLPKSWKKDLEPVWVKGDRDLLKQVLNREGEMSRGIQMYQQGYSNWDNLTKPYADMLSKQPNFGVEQQVQLFHSLMNSHLRMLGLQGTEKNQFATQLLKAYGISPQDLIGQGGTAAPPPPALPPEVVNRMQQLEQKTTAFDRYLEQREMEKVNAFFDDPKNEFANDVASEIMQLLQADPSMGLAAAYEKAVWLNPSVRTKILDKEHAERTRKAEEKAAETRRLNNLNRKGTDGGTPPKGTKKESVDDTIEGVVSKYSSTH